ncbi:cation-transporting P-type ATPase [Clostridium sp.]|uniref:P-type ATPase n=1 Tax=Clostridium sp. TaxID=1506 RepID=UPI001A575391|nr:cation-transporting P-type ATPase [Clostridium sp.]MBK5234499.1 cation-transporting P-type ATPase [Clostridium sp.]
MKKWYGKTMTRVVEILDSDIRLGLTENKIKYMRETYGENIILKPKSQSVLTLIVDKIKQLWIIVSIIFIGMLLYNKLYIIACIVTLIAVISIIILIHVEYKEEKSLMTIDNLNTPFSNIIRNGKTLYLCCEEMVVGDIVFLEKGAYVTADIRILESTYLKVKEVAVTGEKYEVEKYSMKIEGEARSLSEIKNIVFKSSVVTEGSGLGIVVATGMNTQIGKIVKVLLERKKDNMFFSKNLNKIANKWSLIILISSLITLIFTIYNKFDIHEIINALIYISMTFNSPMFFIILFLFFNIIFSQFKKRHIYIKNISAIYALSNISKIFTKKIGAISENKLILREVYCDNILIDVQNHNLVAEGTVERIISIALLCNDAKLCGEGETCIENTNSIESLAEYEILRFCNEEFVEQSQLESKQERIFKIPYDPDKKIKTIVNKIEDRYRANVKGGLDSLLHKCTHILINSIEKEIKESDIENIINVHIDMSNKAYSVVGFGYRNFSYEPSIDENIESNLVFVGLMGFDNPIKENSYAAMETCRSLNIKPIIDEEDNKLASFAFGKLIGITHKKEEVLSGIEIENMSKEELEKNIEKVSIFSKISPKDKNEIVNSLNYKGHYIASVGDTLTDLEYLNNSHISISTGNECSNVVRKLSSLFLQENDFSEIINLVGHSRKIINYINALVLFLSAAGLSEVLMIVVCLITKGEMPFSLTGTLYLNLIILPFCGFAILLQNRKTNQNLKNFNYKYIRRISIVNSLILSGIYFFILVALDKFTDYKVQDFSLVIFALYQNIFGLTFIYEKHFLKNKISYILVGLNLLLQIILCYF